MDSRYNTALAGVFVMLAASCGSDDAPNNAHDFLVAYRDAHCDNIERCCRDDAGLQAAFPGAVVITYRPSKQACQQQYMPVPTTGTVYDPTKAAACLRAVKAATAVCESIGVKDTIVCEQALHGTKRAGDACKGKYECDVPEDGSSVAGCLGASGDCVVWKQPGHAGDNCDLLHAAESSFRCDEDTFCNGQTCTARLGEGEDCSGDACARGLACESEPGAVPGSPRSCVKRGEGARCGPGGTCGHGFACDDRRTCVCHALKKPGASCSSPDQCLGYCESGHCRGDESSGPSLCEPPPSIEIGSAPSPDAGIAICPGPAPTQVGPTPDQAACKDSAPANVSQECAACACSAGAACPAAVMACDASCWGLIQCIGQMCPDFAQMAMQNDFSCLMANCSDFLNGATAAMNAGQCINQCATQCSP